MQQSMREMCKLHTASSISISILLKMTVTPTPLQTERESRAKQDTNIIKAKDEKRLVSQREEH